MIFVALSNAAYRVSLRGPGAELEGGFKHPTPSRAWKSKTPSGSRVNLQARQKKTEQHIKEICFPIKMLEFCNQSVSPDVAGAWSTIVKEQRHNGKRATHDFGDVFVRLTVGLSVHVGSLVGRPDGHLIHDDDICATPLDLLQPEGHRYRSETDGICHSTRSLPV